MMTLKFTPFINLKRNAKEAIQFYEKVIDAKVLTLIKYGDMPKMPNTYTEYRNFLNRHIVMLSSTP